MNTLDRILSRCAIIAGLVSGLGLVLMLILIMTDVTLKYVADRPVTGTLEIVSYYFMPVMVYLALPYVEKSRDHIAVPLVTDMLPPGLRRGLELLVAVLSAGFLLLLAWTCAEKAMDLTRSNEAIGLIAFELWVWPPRWLVPLAYGLMAVQLLRAPFVTQPQGHLL